MISCALKAPILLKPHQRDFFDLTQDSRYVIYSFKNDMPDNSYDLVILLSKYPSDVNLFVYYSETDVTENLESLIKYDENTGTFSGGYYAVAVNSLYDHASVVILNKDTIGNSAEFLKPGFIYVVINLTPTIYTKEFYDWFYIYNTYDIPELFQTKYQYFATETIVDYFHIGSHFLKPITYFIPTLTKNILIKYTLAMFYIKSYTFNDNIRINFYQNSTSGEPKYTISLDYSSNSNVEDYIELEKGFCYYVQITHSTNLYYREEIMFQLVPDKVQRVYEGHPISISTLGFRYLSFYLDVSDSDDEYFFFKIFTIRDKEITLVPKELGSNDYDYIVSQTSYIPEWYCEKNKRNEDGKITYYYKCHRNGGTNTKAFLLFMEINGEAGMYPTLYAEYLPLHRIKNPFDIEKVFKGGQVGYYLLYLKELAQYHYNMLLYTNSKNGLTVNIFFYQPSRVYNYEKIHYNIKLFYIDPDNPEREKTYDDKIAEYYTIFLHHPYEEEYSFNIKFISKDLIFTQELSVPIKNSMKKMVYNGNRESDIHNYHIKTYSEDINEYTVTYQKIYGNYNAEMILLDNIKCKYIRTFMNNDLSFNKKYLVNLNKISKLTKNVFIHINVNKVNITNYFQPYISFYKNIFKIDNTSQTLKTGTQTRVILNPGESSDIYFDTSLSQFNFEIKFLGNVENNYYQIRIKACNIKNDLILNSNNIVVRGQCTNVNSNTKITLKSEGTKVTGVIIKMALSSNMIHHIISTQTANFAIVDKTIVIKYERNLIDNLIFDLELYLHQKQNGKSIAVYEEYSDINYLSYPPNYLESEEISDFSSYKNLINENSIVYNDKVKKEIKETDNYFVIITCSNRYSSLNFFKYIKKDVSNEERKDISLNKESDNFYFFILPQKSKENNFDSLYLQIYQRKIDIYINYHAIYYDLNEFETIYCTGSDYEFLNSYKLYGLTEQNILSIIRNISNYDYIMRYALFNSNQKEYLDYDYTTSYIKNTSIFLDSLESTKVYPDVRINIRPQENNGCSNYYFYVFKPGEIVQVRSYYDFLWTDLSKYYYHNITAKNVCSINGEIVGDDINKFIFELKTKKSSYISVLGYSEQIGRLNAIKYYSSKIITFKYDVYLFHDISLDLNEEIMIPLDQNEQERAKFNVTYKNDGNLYIFWTGSKNDYKQDFVIYGQNYKSGIKYNSKRYSNYEHNYILQNVKANSFNYMFYESVDDPDNKKVYFTFTHKLGKKFGYAGSTINNHNVWKVYTSGIYKFYTEINNDDTNGINKLVTFRFKYNQNKINSIEYIKKHHIDKNLKVITTTQKNDYFCPEIHNHQYTQYCYFTAYTELPYLIQNSNLKYIQIEFKITFKDGQNPKEYEELSIERVSPNKINDSFYAKIDDLINKNKGELGIYYLDIKELKINSYNSFMFYINRNISETPLSIYFGDYIDFTLMQYLRERIYQVDKQFFVFNSKSLDKYMRSYLNSDIILLLVGNNKDNTKNDYSKNFIEFKKFEKDYTNIYFDFNSNRNESTLNKLSFSYDKANQYKPTYYITYYDLPDKNFGYIKNIKGSIDFYYISEKRIFSDKITKIDDILTDISSLSINEHPNEVFEGYLDIFTISCREFPASAEFYMINDTDQVNFEGNNNKFIGAVYINSIYQLTKSFKFSLSYYNNKFKYIMKIIKIVGHFNNSAIKYKLKDYDNYKILEENKLITSGTTDAYLEKPTIQVNRTNIGKGVIFIQFMKAFDEDSGEITKYEGNIFDNKFLSSHYIIMSYNNTYTNTEKATLTFYNQDDNTQAKICLMTVYGNYPFIEIPEKCETYIIKPHYLETISIKNPYKSLGRRLTNENNNIYYTIFNSTLSIEFSYFYSFNTIELPEKEVKSIDTEGETQFELKNSNSKYDNIVYQINNCHKFRYSNYKVGRSTIYSSVNDVEYGILPNYKSNNYASIVLDKDYSDKISVIKFFYVETSYNDIKSLMNKNVHFDYKVNDNNLELIVQNFQDQESTYYALRPYDTDSFLHTWSCRVINMFNSKTQVDILGSAKGRGKDGTTTIKIKYKDINEDCFIKNCSILVFAKSDENLLNKVYELIKLPILVDNGEDENFFIDNIFYFIGGIALLIIIIVTVIICCKCCRKNKNMNEEPPLIDKTYLDNGNMTDNANINIGRGKSINELILLN